MGKINLIAEAGINAFYGDDPTNFLSNAKRLIKLAAVTGFDYVKFQKKDPEYSVPEHKHNDLKDVPWKPKITTYLQYKKDTEFGYQEYEELSRFAKEEGIELFSSVWDIPSAEFMKKFTSIVKIPSAKITNLGLLEYCRRNFKTRILSTGMSTEEEVIKAVNILNPQVIMHTNSVYPTPIRDAKLGYIDWLKYRWPTKDIGYSNHVYGTKIIYFAVGKGVNWVEVHITEDHSLWGSDQKSSVEPNGMFEIVKAIRSIENVLDDGMGPRHLFPGEDIKKKSLRG